MMNLMSSLLMHLNAESQLSNDALLKKVLDFERMMPGKISTKSITDAENLLRISELSQHNDINMKLKAHSDGLSFCPKNSAMAGTHYARRAIVLQKLKLFKEALQDIDLAFEHPISQDVKNDLSVRKEIIQGLLEAKPGTKVPEEKVLLTYGENLSISGVSRAITLAYNQADGQHFIATQPIKIGDVLMIQKPYFYLSLQNPDDPILFEKPSFICQNCLHYTMAPIPCENCIRAAYCSKKCRSEAYDKFHKIECRISTSNDSEYNLAMRFLMIITQQGEKLKEVLQVYQELQNNSEEVNSAPDEFDPSDIKVLLSLPSLVDKTTNVAFASFAGKLASVLKKLTSVVPREIDAFDLAKLTLALIHIGSFNAYKIRRQSNIDIVALGLYPVLNQMKHSCYPNTMHYNDNDNNKIVCAVRDIKVGEKITVNSLCHEDILKTNAATRKSVLKNMKEFDCECEVCEKKYTFKFELKNKVKVPEDLKKSLRENPKDVKALWELLKTIHNQFKSPCREVKLVELGILDALMGKANTELAEAFKVLDII